MSVLLTFLVGRDFKREVVTTNYREPGKTLIIRENNVQSTSFILHGAFEQTDPALTNAF